MEGDHQPTILRSETQKGGCDVGGGRTGGLTVVEVLLGTRSGRLPFIGSGNHPCELRLRQDTAQPHTGWGRGEDEGKEERTSGKRWPGASHDERG